MGLHSRLNYVHSQLWSTPPTLQAGLTNHKTFALPTLTLTCTHSLTHSLSPPLSLSLSLSLSLTLTLSFFRTFRHTPYLFQPVLHVSVESHDAVCKLLACWLFSCISIFVCSLSLTHIVHVVCQEVIYHSTLGKFLLFSIVRLFALTNELIKLTDWVKLHYVQVYVQCSCDHDGSHL